MQGSDPIVLPSGLFKEKDALGNQQRGPLQNGSNQGLDYAGMPTTGKFTALNQFVVFDVKSSWNGRAKGMQEGPNAMARRVIGSAQTWGLGPEKDYATHMDRSMGRAKYSGYLIQFDRLGNSKTDNHVRISEWKYK